MLKVCLYLIFMKFEWRVYRGGSIWCLQKRVKRRTTFPFIFTLLFTFKIYTPVKDKTNIYFTKIKAKKFVWKMPRFLYFYQLTLDSISCPLDPRHSGRWSLQGSVYGRIVFYSGLSMWFLDLDTYIDRSLSNRLIVTFIDRYMNT